MCSFFFNGMNEHMKKGLRGGVVLPVSWDDEAARVSKRDVTGTMRAARELGEEGHMCTLR